MQDTYYSWFDQENDVERLLCAQTLGEFTSFLIWGYRWWPVSLLSRSETGFNVVTGLSGDELFIFDPEDSLLIACSDLTEVPVTEISAQFPHSDEVRIPADVREYLEGQPTDLDRCQYIYGLGRASVSWEQDRSIEHLEAIYALTSFVGLNNPDSTNLSDWESNLYPLTLLTDGWLALGPMQFTMVDLLNWGFDGRVAVAFNEVIGILKAALKYEDVSPSNAWAVVSAFLLGALSERGNPEAFAQAVENVEDILGFLDAPAGMCEIVAAHWEEQIYPGH